MTEDLYKTLGVPRDATEADIKKAFRDRSKYEHPDMLPQGVSPAIYESWTARFQAVSAAYAVLSDPAKRAAYDSGARDVDVADLAAYGSELVSTLAALRGADEDPTAFARRLSFAAARDVFRLAQTQDGRRTIAGVLQRIGRRPP